MTRINVIPVEKLHDKHLRGEYREITRPFKKVRARQQKGQTPEDVKGPKDYVLGRGHETFFFTRLKFVTNRYKELTKEMRRRGFNASPVKISKLTKGIDAGWMGDYKPTKAAIRLNKQRIRERLAEIKD